MLELRIDLIKFLFNNRRMGLSMFIYNTCICSLTEGTDPWVQLYLVIGLNQTLGRGFHRHCK